MKQKLQTNPPPADGSTQALEGQDAGSAHSATPEQQLLVEFQKLLQAHRWAFKQERTFQRTIVLMVGLMCALGRHTVSQCILSVGAGQRDWTAWYRLFSGRRFRQADLEWTLLAETVKDAPAQAPYVVVMDTTQTPRSSATLPGSGWAPSPRSPVFARGLHRAQRWLMGAWLPTIVQGFSRAIPLRCVPAFTAKAAQASVPACKDWEAGQTFVAWVRSGLDALKRPAQMLVVLADGAFDVLGLWQRVPERTVLIVRTARNRVLYELPGRYLGRGRPRLYGPRAPSPEQYLHERAGWTHATFNVRGRFKQLRYKLRGCYLRERVPHQPVFLLVIAGQYWPSGSRRGLVQRGRTGHTGRRSRTRRPRRRERAEVFYLISAVQRDGVWVLPYPPELILQWAWQRWEIEVAHREMKAGFGVGQMQCWGWLSSILAMQWTVWVYAVMVLAAYRAWGWTVPNPLPCAWWRGAARWSFNTLWRYFRIALWRLDLFHPLAPQPASTDPNPHPRWSWIAQCILAAARA